MRAARWVVVVLAACGGDDAPARVDAPTVEDDAPGAVPMIGDALAGMCGAYTPPSAIAAGNDLLRVEIDDPLAVCNDGTRAVMYVRPSTGGANANRWLIYLQGGNACSGIGDCTERYCGTGNYTKARMSSTWTPPAARSEEQGIYDRDGTNPFADANTVVLYYCSSDLWTGQQSDVVLKNPQDATQRYRVHFRGHTILAAALDQLLPGITVPQGSLPPLEDATFVLFAGTSAGGGGVANNADYVRDRLTPKGTMVRAVVDANAPPRLEDLDAATRAARETLERDEKYPIVTVGRYGAFLDTSCAATHTGADAWLCANQNHLLTNHVTTPFFARQDLRDGVVGGGYLDHGLTRDDLATRWRTSMTALAAIQSTAEETIGVAPGVYAPNCGQHVAITNDAYFEQSQLGPVGSQRTFRAALGEWLLGSDVALIDTQPRAASSTCPPEQGGTE